MEVVVATDFRCTIYDNKYYLDPKSYRILERYAKGFDELTLWSRIEKKNAIPMDYKEAYFLKEVIPITSLFDVLTRSVDEKIKEKINKADIIICRLPSIPGIKAGLLASKYGIPLLSEVMSDAWACHWYHSIAGKLIAPYMEFMTKRILKLSDYAIYVTENFLQRKYPCNGLTLSASNVVLKVISNEVLEQRMNKINSFSLNNFTLLTVADVGIPSKGHRYVIRALGLLKSRGINVTYFLAGPGESFHLKQEAEKAGVLNQVVFLGRLTKDEVFEWLQKVDVYIHPSLQEGLPRAVIEAMGYALPILASDTAGTPELLDKEFVFKKGSTNCILSMLLNLDKEKIKVQSRRNFSESQKYREKILDSKRSDFFTKVCIDLLKNNKKGS